MRDFVQWTAPSPLWEAAIRQTSAALRREELSRPSILRFATDSFMDDFLQMLAHDPKKLDQYVASPETWRGISPPPEKEKPVPAFARNFHRLGLAARRKNGKNNSLLERENKIARFSDEAAEENPLKLYQPAHQRFYLISACLVCERPGLPDKALNTGREEKVSFVIRRLFPKGDLRIDEPLPPLDSTWEEHAFVLTEQDGAKWQRIAGEKKAALASGEEQLPLFSVDFIEDDNRRRKLFAGVVPAGKREAYMAAGNFAPVAEKESALAPGDLSNAELLRDSRVILFNSIVRDPWKSLLQAVGHSTAAIAERYDGKAQPAAVTENLLKTSREQMQAISWLILLDFADFLKKNLPKIWSALTGQAVLLNDAENKLKNAIIATVPNAAFASDINTPNPANSRFFMKTGYRKTDFAGSLKDALLKITGTNPTTKNKYALDLETVSVNYDRAKPNGQFPDFLFPLADPAFNLQTNAGKGVEQITPTVFTDAANGFKGEDVVNRFAALVKEVIRKMPQSEQNQPLQATPLAAETPMDMREGFYIIRCVYERPLCGAIDPTVLSEPTEPFQIAGFFDADAPARPIRIALPIDTTPAGLRKFNKNTAFMMSDLLCGQVNRMKGITFGDLIRSVLPFPLHKDLDVPDSGGCKKSDNPNISIGMICSLSIPIITICALILLMIIVSLLDFIFRWMPFFIMCFPLPGLKGKK